MSTPLRPGDETTFEVPVGTRRERVDKVLSRAFPELSRGAWQRVIEAGNVWRDDEPLIKKTPVGPGDSLAFRIPEERPSELRPVAIPLTVLHEDADLIVIAKDPGMVVHPGAGTGEDTLVHALLHHTGGVLSLAGGTERPGIVHRLDKETSGAMVAAKSDAAFYALTRAFSERVVEKEYLAIVSGYPEGARDRSDAPIGRHPQVRTRMTVRTDGRAARSEWRVVERIGTCAALIAVRIHTGRTHQIRVHLSHAGFPLLGDPTYGFRRECVEPVAIPRVMLHSANLRFQHPASGAWMDFAAPLPDDFRHTLARLIEQFGSDPEA